MKVCMSDVTKWRIIRGISANYTESQQKPQKTWHGLKLPWRRRVDEGVPFSRRQYLVEIFVAKGCKCKMHAQLKLQSVLLTLRKPFILFDQLKSSSWSYSQLALSSWHRRLRAHLMPLPHQQCITKEHHIKEHHRQQHHPHPSFPPHLHSPRMPSQLHPPYPLSRVKLW